MVGVVRVGAAGIAGTVVKLQMLDHALVPPALVAFTRQKKVVLLARPVTAAVVTERPVWFETVVAKVDIVDTCAA